MNKEIMKSYYPYDLRVINPSTSSTIYRIKMFDTETYFLEDSWHREIEISYKDTNYKSVLYSLNQLDSYIKVKGGISINFLDIISKLLTDYFSLIQVDPRNKWIKEILFNYFQNKSTVPFTHKIMKAIYNLLYRFHFDLDNLIESGEAIDAITLRVNPYDFYPINW
ncbi:hypothetical protein [Odoribacter laneus]|uniref:hypothetical protein n=1 Tax=Odoribacter laneus TaxID=626933 RepID=UPI003AF4CD54